MRHHDGVTEAGVLGMCNVFSMCPAGLFKRYLDAECFPRESAEEGLDIEKQLETWPPPCRNGPATALKEFLMAH